MNTQTQDFIGVYDGAIPPELCRLLIDDFELNHKYQTTISRKAVSGKPGSLIDDDSLDYNSPDIGWVFSDGQAAHHLAHIVHRFHEMYAQLLGGFYGIEPVHFNAVKVQRTGPGQGYHVWHCEQGSRESAHKFLFYIAYLNTVSEGGETEFLHQARRVRAKEGRLLLAPACFTHLHRGNPPLNDYKYVATGWLEW